MTTMQVSPASETVAKELNGLLADGIVFYQKLRNYHWYVKGPKFFVLHAKFEELYDRWAEWVDELAERLLAMGGNPIPTLKDALAATSITEETGSPEADAMMKNILADLEQFSDKMTNLISAAEDADDRPTANLLDEINDQIRTDCWMLRAYLG
jgi:starvation-inducible DNA-binding protein